MKFSLSLLIVCIVALSSCGVHIQKRLYRNGFYISTNSHREAEPATHREKITAEQPIAEEIVPDTSIYETDRVSTFKETQPVAPAAVITDTVPANEEQTVNEPVVTQRKQESPPDAVPAVEMESLRQLYIASIVVLIAWLILSPLSTIVSLVLALIMLKRIQSLKEMYSPTDNQQVQLEKYRSFEMITLIASIVVLALTVLAVALFLAIFFGALTFGFL